VSSDRTTCLSTHSSGRAPLTETSTTAPATTSAAPPPPTTVASTTYTITLQALPECPEVAPEGETVPPTGSTVPSTVPSSGSLPGTE
jgi:hypothetical protein